jgi:diacylglycerol kinase family enzyme
MRVALLYNADAGDGVSAEDLRHEIAGAGHELVCEVEQNDGFDPAVDAHVDCCIVAGGDGTIRAAALALADANIPIALLALGTANNIAKSLGVRRSVRETMRGWRLDRKIAFDFGAAHGPWGKRRFLEGVGSGLVPAATSAVKADKEKRNAHPQGEVAYSLGVYLDTLSRLKPHPFRLTLDGAVLEGEFLLVEVLNIPSVGPNLALSPGSDPTDGLLEVVVAGEAERDDVAGYLLRRLRAEHTQLMLPVRRAKNVEICCHETVQLDDEVHDVVHDAVAVDVERGAVEFLI